MAMIYTSYKDRLDELPTNVIKLIIMRYPPEINLLKYENLHLEKSLAPSPELFEEYKNTNKAIEDWRDFSNKFNKEIETRQDMKNAINQIVELVSMGIDIYLICSEENPMFCHRTLLAKYINNKYGIEWKEF